MIFFVMTFYQYIFPLTICLLFLIQIFIVIVLASTWLHITRFCFFHYKTCYVYQIEKKNSVKAPYFG
jgi:hypothetical protein